MRHLIKARVIAGAIMGVVFGVMIHHDKVHKLMMGREGFIAYEADRYDKFYAHTSLIPEVCLWVIGFGLFLTAYEYVVTGISMLLARCDRQE